MNRLGKRKMGEAKSVSAGLPFLERPLRGGERMYWRRVYNRILLKKDRSCRHGVNRKKLGILGKGSCGKEKIGPENKGRVDSKERHPPTEEGTGPPEFGGSGEGINN